MLRASYPLAMLVVRESSEFVHPIKEQFAEALWYRLGPIELDNQASVTEADVVTMTVILVLLMLTVKLL